MISLEVTNIQADDEGNFIPEREGYVNDVIVEGKIVVEGSILAKDGSKKAKEGDRTFHYTLMQTEIHT